MPDNSTTTWPALPQHWHLASIIVRRDPGWCFGGALTYDALLERDGGDHEARGVGSDPVSAVADAIREIANG